MAVFAPMPRASDSTATAVKTGLFREDRKAYRRSAHRWCMAVYTLGLQRGYGALELTYRYSTSPRPTIVTHVLRRGIDPNHGGGTGSGATGPEAKVTARMAVYGQRAVIRPCVRPRGGGVGRPDFPLRPI